MAETNRAPFDLAEAESELVSGFMTEHAAVIFVFFFLAEYASILLICILTSILFLGGYLLFLGDFLLYLTATFETIDHYSVTYLPARSFYVEHSNILLLSYPMIEGMMYGLVLGLKSCIMIFTFI